MLAHNTNLRQGDLITHESATTLRLVEAADAQRRVVIITHDCDLPNPAESCVEVIVACALAENERPDPQLCYAKNPRRLHLPYTDGAQTRAMMIELRHDERRSLPRAVFLEHASKDTIVTLAADGKRVLKQWLAARYGRPAFPDAFEARLRRMVGKRTITEHIHKILAQPEAEHIIGVFFDLGEQRGTEVPDKDPYALSVSIVYDAIEGGPAARRAAETAAQGLRQLFEKAYGPPAVATEIALDSCEAIADTAMTLAALRRVDQWRLEHISLRDGDMGEFLPTGEIPP